MADERTRGGGWTWLAFGALLVGLAIAERLSPLRRRVERGPRHAGRNRAIAGLGALTTILTELPVLPPVRRWTGRRRLGLLPRLLPPGVVRTALGVLLLDYTLFVWHWLNHRVPFLWRFHLAHHVDLDLDSSTGVRFHFGELALSTGFRAAQIVLLGVDARALAIWQRLLVASVVFHHSNLRLPIAAERTLGLFLVTPRMHGIHHSIVRRETDSNFSSLFAWWDWCHGTMRLNVPQDAITIGVPAYRDPEELTLPRVLALPAERPRPWRLPSGEVPARAVVARPADRLAP